MWSKTLTDWIVTFVNYKLYVATLIRAEKHSFLDHECLLIAWSNKMFVIDANMECWDRKWSLMIWLDQLNFNSNFGMSHSLPVDVISTKWKGNHQIISSRRIWMNKNYLNLWIWFSNQNYLISILNIWDLKSAALTNYLKNQLFIPSLILF